MMLPPKIFMDPTFIIELIYTLLVVLVCGIIYFKTREAYKLTEYKGLKYFRNFFLFLGLAYLAKFFVSYSMIFGRDFRHFLMFSGYAQLFLLIMVYASSVALVYLFYSLFWKKIKLKINEEILIHIFALVITLATLSFPKVFVLIQFIIFALLVIAGVLEFRKKKSSKMYLIYFSIFGLWIITNLAGLLSLTQFQGVLFIYGVTITLFFVLLFRALGDLDKNGKKR